MLFRSINQGELQFSFRYYPTVDNSRTYKVHLGAEQYLQLFVNNNWTIENVEELNIVGDDGTGLLRPDADSDIVVGRTNAESKMYQGSVVDNDDDGKANDVVNRGYDFRLKLHPGKWKEGKSGTIRITFKNVMHTVANEYFPFYRTIDLQMVSETKSYTTAGNPLFYLYPIRHDNRLLVTSGQNKGRVASISDAETICNNIGDGWRLPTASELLLSFAYVDALGGNALGSSEAYGQNIYGWYQNWTGNYWSSSYYSEGSTGAYFELDFGAGYPKSGSATNFFRCVRDNKNSGKKYPYLSVASSGVTIVSRDADGGVDPTLLFASGDTPDTSNGMNKIAPKLLIGNTSLNGKSWAEAKAACESIGAGWRLPTQREMYMIVSLGGTKLSLDNQGFGASADWGTDFQKIAAMHWALTARDNAYWLVGYNWESARSRNEFSAWTDPGTSTWPSYRCVRSVVD